MKLLSVFFSMLIICLSVGVSARNGPIVKLGTATTTASIAIVPVTVDNFNDIKSFDLKISYDPSVAIPSTITKSAELNGALTFYTGVAGEIKLIWNAPVASVSSLNNGAILFNIKFNRVGTGTSHLIFDETTDLYDCQFNDANGFLYDLPGENYYKSGSLTFNSQVSPVITAPVITDCSNSDINVPVTIKDFKQIGAVSLTLKYDPLVLSFNSGINTANFPGLIIDENTVGTIKIGGISSDPNGFNLTDGATLFSLNFTYLGGVTNLNWFDNGESCEFNSQFPDYKVLVDTPQSTYYINGSVGSVQVAPVPEIVVGEFINPVSCNGYGTIPLTFTNVPDGTYTINFIGGSFPNIDVLASAAVISAPAGIYNDLQITVNGETSVLGVNVVLTDPESPVQPVIIADGPTSFCEGGNVVLTSGEALTYLWSNGETTQNITATASGNYSVTVSNASGCSATSEVTAVTVNARSEQPEKVNCWDDYQFNETLCTWENKGTKPAITVKQNCWDEFVFNNTTCMWDNIGTKPVEPTPVNCWDEFNFNTNTCMWENIGIQPVDPVKVNCWDNYHFNETLCAWENNGTEPVKPESVNCWDELIFNSTICVWENVGIKPTNPATINCWDDFNFNTISCEWENTGVEPEKPAMVNCWDEYQFVEATCTWENKGTKPVKPTPVKSWDEFIFNPVSCTWENIGVATGVEIYGHVAELTLTSFPNPFTEKATIQYWLPENGNVNIEVTGILGNRIKMLSNQFQSEGEYLLDLEGEKLASGIYQITLRFTDIKGDEWTKTVRMIKH